MSYSEALEQQVAMLRFMETDAASEWTSQLLRTNKGEHPTGEARALHTVMERGLAMGETFYWDPDLIGLLARAAETLPDWTADAAALPCPDGFLWLGAPLSLSTDDPSGVGAMVALTWSTGAFIHEPGRESAQFLAGISDEVVAQHPAGIFITCYRRPRTGIRLPAVPAAVFAWPFGDSLAHAALENVGRGMATTTEKIRVFSAAMLLLGQTIVTAPSQQAERHARKRLEREGWTHEPLIRVVQLRRKERIGNPDAVQPTDREYSCQWIVRGHWRQQWFPKAQRNQPIWITPYVKGPEDKPLKAPRATVFAVVR